MSRCTCSVDEGSDFYDALAGPFAYVEDEWVPCIELARLLIVLSLNIEHAERDLAAQGEDDWFEEQVERAHDAWERVCAAFDEAPLRVVREVRFATLSLLGRLSRCELARGFVRIHPVEAPDRIDGFDGVADEAGSRAQVRDDTWSLILRMCDRVHAFESASFGPLPCLRVVFDAKSLGYGASCER